MPIGIVAISCVPLVHLLAKLAVIFLQSLALAAICSPSGGCCLVDAIRADGSVGTTSGGRP
jgi:hypothetical protein